MINDIPPEFRPPHIRPYTKATYKPVTKRRKFITITDGKGSREVKRKAYRFFIVSRIHYIAQENHHGNLVYFQGEDGIYHYLNAFPAYLDLRTTLGDLKDKVLSLKAYTQMHSQLQKG